MYSFILFHFLLISFCIIDYLGSHIGDLLVYDADKANTMNSLLTFKLLSQSPTNPSDGMFSIDQMHGRIQVAKHDFRRTNVSQYHLKVSVADEGELIVLCLVKDSSFRRHGQISNINK